LLIVDDDAVDRQLYVRLLSQRKADALGIEQAADGARGLVALRTRQFDCVVLDMNLPDMTGLEFLAQVAVDGVLPCGFVLVTGEGNEAIAVAAMKSGAQDYLAKDKINESSIRRAVTRAIEQTELRQRLATLMRSLTVTNKQLAQEVATRKAAEDGMRLAKDAAERASREKSRFLSGMSHELRTPLNGILGYARLLRMEGGLNPVQAARVEAMLDAGSHLLEMVHCVLDLSQIETGLAEPMVAELDLRRVGEACLDLLRPAAELKGLSLTLSVAPDVPIHIMIDAMRLRQIMLNLVGNAVKFTAAGSVAVRLVVLGTDSVLRWEVADTGPGVPAAQRHRLFQSFDRLNDESIRKEEGAGLGLFLSSQLATLMGGQVGHMDNPAGGSIFWLELPLVLGAGTAVPPPCEQVAGRSLHVLVVDDVYMNRDIAGAFLQLAGHAVTYAANGAEALAAAQITDFDAILMDVQMPEMDGMEATSRIRAITGPRGRVPIIALTAHVFTEQVEACRKAGMDDHLVKPFTPESLIEVVTRAVAPIRRRASDEWDPEDKSQACTEASIGTPVETGFGSETPVFDHTVFERLNGLLRAEVVSVHLQTLAGNIAALLQQLHAPDALADGSDALVHSAHGLAGEAGMFGFARLVHVARHFERAVQTGSEDAVPRLHDLSITLAATLKEIPGLIGVTAAV
jgi:signal transduction histidine kinase/HPt (histidine-containing phosphotransfer) domain-containing protein